MEWEINEEEEKEKQVEQQQQQNKLIHNYREAIVVPIRYTCNVCKITLSPNRRRMCNIKTKEK